jgi:putative peptidoglycan lipid II flippase
MTAFILSNLVGLLRNILVLRAFGTGAEMEAFNVANQMSETLFTLVAGGALASSFIPTFTGLLTQGERKAAWQLASSIANLILIVVVFLSLLSAVFAPQIVRYLIAPGFAVDPEKEALTVQLMRIMLPSAVIFGLSGLVMGILNSFQVFLIPALTPSLYALGMIFGVTVLSPRMGIHGLALGVLLGAALHLAMQFPSLLKRGVEYYPILGLKLPAVREVGRLLIPRLFGVAVVQLNFWVNILIASFFPGAVPALKAAFTLMLMPQIAIAQSIAIAAMPTLAAQYTRSQFEDFRHSLAASLRGVLLLSIPASVGLILLRRPLIRLIYERGAFDAQSTDLVAWALLWYAAGLVGHCVVEVLARAFYALHDTKTPVMVGAAAMGLNIALSIALSTFFNRIGLMPHGGLALANSIATGLEMVGLLVLMRRRLNGIDGKNILNAVLVSAAASALMGLGIWLWLYNTHDLPVWQVIIGGVSLGGIIYAALALLAAPEARGLLRFVRRRLGH